VKIQVSEIFKQQLDKAGKTERIFQQALKIAVSQEDKYTKVYLLRDIVTAMVKSDRINEAYSIAISIDYDFAKHQALKVIAVEMVRKLELPFSVIINQSDLGDDQVRQYCDEENIYDYDVIWGGDLPGIYGEDYNDPNITQYCWFRVNQSLVDFWFTEDCTHKVFYFAKDNLCHRTNIWNYTFHVDDEAPYMDITYPEHGYYKGFCESIELEFCKQYLKVNTNITLNAYDLPDNECNTSIESIFWRYYYDGDSYP